MGLYERGLSGEIISCNYKVCEVLKQAVSRLRPRGCKKCESTQVGKPQSQGYQWHRPHPEAKAWQPRAAGRISGTPESGIPVSKAGEAKEKKVFSFSFCLGAQLIRWCHIESGPPHPVYRPVSSGSTVVFTPRVKALPVL